MTIPVAAPVRWFEQHQQAVAAAVAGVMSGGQYILGPRVDAFERAFAAFCACPHAVAVASGTDAITLGLRVLDAAGGEVITSAHTAVATVAAIERAGAIPVVADIDPVTHCLCPESVASVLSPRTRAIVAVHIFGHPADLRGLRAVTGSRAIGLVEDCAQAVLARTHDRPVGSLGDVGCFSLHPLKTLNACGDGGVITTNDADLARQFKVLRNIGLRTREDCAVWSHNSRLDTLQAAMLLVKLDLLPAWTEARRAHARFYQQQLADVVQTPLDQPFEYAVYHTFVVQASARDALRAFLTEKGVGTAIHYPAPIHVQQAAASLGYQPNDFPETMAQAGRIVSLPVYPELTEAQRHYVVEQVRSFYDR